MLTVSTDAQPITVLIAGIGGGSLGLEIFKSLQLAGGYRLIGTDISSTAYGLGEASFAKTYQLTWNSEEDYVAQLLGICRKHQVEAVAPGAGAVHSILARHRAVFEREHVLVMLNSSEVITLCSDKSETMRFLVKQGIPVPLSQDVTSVQKSRHFGKYPCVVKPTSASGASNLVFLAENEKESLFFVTYLMDRGYQATLQEYIPSLQEFTVGVLSSPQGEVLTSVALRRMLEPKLSCAMRYQDRVISSGWSQGEIDDFPLVRKQAEDIARLLHSTWALNIQGRLDETGTFYLFEINPRHSGTTYLRALAGINEPHILLQYCLRGKVLSSQQLRKGFYVRSFVEKYIPKKEKTIND